jgi:uncharacterized protein YqeY
MSLRAEFPTSLKAAMLGGDTARTGTLRLIMAKLKDADIAARPALSEIPEDQVVSMLRGMVKQRRESIELYIQGKRQDLVDKESAEIAVIESFLPQQMGEAALQDAVAAAIAETGAATIKDMGRVMAALKARHAASLDLARAGAVVKGKLG